MSQRVEIDLKRIESELKELAGSIPVKVRRGNGMRLSIKETDKLTRIYINPRKIRTQAELDDVVIQCQKSLVWGE